MGPENAKEIRRQAAARALEGQPVSDATSAEQARELAAMRALIGTLESLPGEAWQPIPARPPRHQRAWLTGTRTRLAGALAASALALLGGGIMIGSELAGHPTTTPQAGHLVALEPLNTPDQDFASATLIGSRRAELAIRRLPASAPGTYYELWEMTDTTKLVPVAAFRIGSSGRARLSLDLPADPSDYAYLDISLQQQNAGPAHSAISVLRGPID